MNVRYAEIDEAIAYIHRNLDEPLPLSRLARHVAFSSYHFARIFKERIGLPPLYYVSSLRLQRAKDLLLNSNLTVRQIGLEIGQQSLGTFTTRFTERVGMTPGEFRLAEPQADRYIRALRELSDWREQSAASIEVGAQVSGTVVADEPFDGFILIGLFNKPIPEGLPTYGTLLPSLGRFSFRGVAPGIYYLMVTSVAWEMQAKDFLLPQRTLRSRTRVPLFVSPHGEIEPLQVKLHPPRPDDPPILISLPVLMNQFLSRMGK
ncbi:helix-turn-helix domain-containing protein [Cohnella sp. JJ-181]|uniref:helix-turn-helix domain-containing protein n=1 Tax=Cohnella rhizoplanae TaxID=2974897 RepID=UPI0022FF6DD5|nr:AraC family transcriptional regulator [Cohnella sp. JJ-181]CAI6032043.1 HTH-type transcriptional activator RhaR [Cohnella sp. JJ-181]